MDLGHLNSQPKKRIKMLRKISEDREDTDNEEEVVRDKPKIAENACYAQKYVLKTQKPPQLHKDESITVKILISIWIRKLWA